LIHGGFTFGLADYAAMLAVNEPTVVPANATAKFLAPVVVGDRLEAEATVEQTDGKKRTVKVTVRRAGAPRDGGRVPRRRLRRSHPGRR